MASWRRTFLSRRISELKAERERLAAERQTSSDELAKLAPAAKAATAVTSKKTRHA